MLILTYLINIIALIELLISSLWNRITILILNYLLTFSLNNNSTKNNGLWLFMTILGSLLFIIIYYAGVCNLMFGEGPILLFIGTSVLKESENKKSVTKKSLKKKDLTIPSEYSLVKNYIIPNLLNKYIFDSNSKNWYFHSNNIWTMIDEEDIKSAVIELLIKHEAIGEDFKMPYLVSVITLLKNQLRLNFAQQPDINNLIVFNNGILNLRTGEFKDFSSEYIFTSKLNINYDPEAKMNQDFVDWLLFISNKNLLFLKVIRSYVYLILTRNNQCHIALYLWGSAGTGKSTFEKLMVSIVSREGTVASDLRRLNGTFETSKLANKNLLLLSDLDQKKADVTKLKSIISGDMISAEKKFQDSFQFFPTCLVILTSNHPLVSNDSSSGIQRRIVSLNFQNIPLARDPNLFYLDLQGKPQGKLAPSLSGFINWVLTNPIEDLKLFSKDTFQLNAKLSLTGSIVSNPLIEWAISYLSNIEGKFTPIGDKSKSKNTHLYPSYLEFCGLYNYTPISFNNFTCSLIDNCNNSLNWINVKKKVTNSCAGLINIVLNEKPIVQDFSNTELTNLASYSTFKGFIKGFGIVKDQQYFKGIIELDNLLYCGNGTKVELNRIKELKEILSTERSYSFSSNETFKPLKTDISIDTTNIIANDDSLNISTKNSIDTIDNDTSSSNNANAHSNNSSNSPHIDRSKTVFLDYTDPANFNNLNANAHYNEFNNKSLYPPFETEISSNANAQTSFPTLQFAPSRASLVKKILNELDNDKNSSSKSKISKSKISKSKYFNPNFIRKFNSKKLLSSENIRNLNDTSISDYDNDYDEYRNWIDKD